MLADGEDGGQGMRHLQAGCCFVFYLVTYGILLTLVFVGNVAADVMWRIGIR